MTSLTGGRETIETVYFLFKLFFERGHRVTIVDPYPAEARLLALLQTRQALP